MTVEEALAKAEEQLSHCIYLSETSTKPGIVKINSNKAKWLSVLLFYAKKAIKDQEERENPKRLTIEELKSLNAPVWLSCCTLGSDHGYWCLCDHGIIMCPSGQCYDAYEVQHWELYLHEPKEV